METGDSNNTYLWDAFEHVLLFVSLLVFSVSFSLTGHYFIDRWFSGVSLNSYEGLINDFTVSLLRGYLSAMIVSLPFFTFLFLHITKKNVDNPQTRNLKSRKSLIYATLVITFVIMLINVISLVFGFVSGNTTVNFILHFVFTMSVNGVIFTYYLYQTKEDRKLNV